ncbi:hypothetical protein [Haloterrigena salinisoli]|uniref:hypothetical protein n=1 Tax=Haloterrigena salinisoli TaxID=3132747 RepID=UPI0030CF64BE
MSETIDISREYSFSPPINIASVLDRLEIQYLDVHKSRALIIFDGVILDLECLDGELTHLERAEITVCDLPLNSDAKNETETALELIGHFKNQLSMNNGSI